MIDALTITALIVAGTSAATFVLRDIINRSAIKEACANTAPDIEKFKKDNTYVIPLTQESRALATVLRTTIGCSRKMRDETIRSVSNIKIPNANIPLGFRELEEVMVHNGNLFLQTVKGNYRFKIKYLYKDQVKHRILHAKQAAREAIMNAMTTSEAGSDGAKQTYEAISKHAMPELDVFEQEIVDFMDQLGIIDASVLLAGKIEAFVHAHMGDATSHFLHNATHLFDSMYEIPGAFIGLRSAITEFNMLIDDETSFEDSFFNGGSAVVIKAVAIKLGMAADALTGGLSAGLFTIGMSYVATKFSNWIIDEQNKGLKQELEKLENEIEDCRKRVLYTINSAVREFEEDFAKRLETCPDINDEISLNQFLDDLKIAYGKGLEWAEHKLAVNTRKAIENLHKNTWVHNLFFIDPRKAMKKLYLEAQRNITSYHAGLVHNFSLKAETHVEDGVGFLLKDVVFNTPETEVVLNKIESVIEICTENYSESLSEWEQKTTAFRKEGSEKVASVIEREKKYHERFIAERKPLMNKLLKRIKANYKRQGKGPVK